MLKVAAVNTGRIRIKMMDYIENTALKLIPYRFQRFRLGPNNGKTKRSEVTKAVITVWADVRLKMISGIDRKGSAE